MFKINNKTPPDCIQRLFQSRVSKYELRGKYMFMKTKARTNVKQRCISVKGANLWNSLDKEMKMCNTLFKFKSTYKYKMINKYKTEVKIYK